VSESEKAPFGGFEDDVFDFGGLVEDKKEPVAFVVEPAKAWGLVFDQGIISIRQVRSREGSFERREVGLQLEVLADDWA